MEKEHDSTGPLVGIIIIILILVLGGIYYAGKTNPEKEDVSLTADDIRNKEDQFAQNLSVQGTSDETAAIEVDLEASDFESLDAEINAIDAEFDTAQ